MEAQLICTQLVAGSNPADGFAPNGYGVKTGRICPCCRAFINGSLPPEDTGYKNSGKERMDMEFLKEILGEDLYKQIEEKINAHNGNEANKEKQIKIANLGGGEYVGKGKYDALQALFDGQKTELDTANNLIADLQKATKGNEEMQGKFTEYQNQVQQLQAQLAETKLNSALKVALLSEKVKDIDYLTFKINEKLKAEGKSLELDENENIKGWEEMSSGLKVQFPAMFEGKGKGREYEEIPLPDGDKRKPEPESLADAIRMQYETQK